MRHLLACFGVSAALLLGSSRDVGAQVCPANVGNLSETATLSVTDAAETCSVTDGSYVKVFTQYRRHVEATVTGFCHTFAWNGSTCVQIGNYTRVAVGSALKINTDPSSTVWGNTGVQHYNTCGNGNCTPVGTTFNGPTFMPFSTGAHVYTGSHVAGGGTLGSGSQYCNMGGTYDSENTITMWALECEPKWNLDSNNNIGRLDTSDTITIYLPAAMSGASTALTSAVADWEARTAFDFDIVTDAPCSGSRCINIETADLSSLCGYTPAYTSDSTGLRTGTQIIQLDTDYGSHSAESKRRTLAHELGHLLGLADYDSSCDIEDAIMQPQYFCDDPDLVDELTINDYLPVNNTVYGTGPRLTCGF